MRKRLDDIFAALMLAASVAVVLAGWYCLSHSIVRAGADPEPMIVAEIHIETPRLDPLPTPTPFPTPEPTAQLFYNPDIPLSQELQEALYEACTESNVPVALALGVIEVESCFQVDAVSSEGCMGLMQLHPLYFPADLSPADNLRAGIEYLGRLLAQHGDTGAALTSYNAGHDTGSRVYAGVVLAAAERWEEELQ